MTDWLKLAADELAQTPKQPADNADVSDKRRAAEAKTGTDSADNPDVVASTADIVLAGLATSAKGLVS